MRSRNTILKDSYGDIRFGWMMVGIISAILLVIGCFAWADIHYSNQGCQYVCDGNGDENAYRWDAGCWCRDEEGVYNPKDGRNDR